MGFSFLVQAVDDPRTFSGLVADAETAGADRFFVADSSLHGRDVWLYLTLAASASDRMQLGPGITHPMTRHPAITANAIATLDEISGGRAVLGIGAGDRPLVELGLRPAPVATLEETIVAMRLLLEGRSVSSKGPVLKMRNAALLRPPDQSTPIVVAASGPRTLRMAGGVADEVLLQVGIHPDCVQTAVDQVLAGAQSVGRDPMDVAMSLMVYGSVRSDRQAARDESRHFAAWIPQTVPKYCEIAGIRSEDVARVRRAYDGGELMQADEAASAVTDEMIDAFTLAGSPAECRDRVTALLDIGIRNITFFPMGADRRGGMLRFADAIGPVLEF